MRRDLIDLAADLARRGEPFALATVVARKAPVSTHVGDTAIVTRDGSFHGWVGGSCTRPTVLAEAEAALADGRPRRVVLDPAPVARDDGAHVFPMTCHSGGSVEIHIQPVLPAPHLAVYGVSPTARALARLAKAMGYAVSAVDPMADASAFPQADHIETEPAGLVVERGAAPFFAVVATQGQWDEDAILAALAHEPDYVAVVASPKRFGEMRSLLASRASEAALARVKNPAGLDLGAQSPEEIALSILAEIVKERPRAAVAASASAATAEAETAVTAIDPVCGMSVAVKGARHRATHAGEEYYFCNAGCRERFIAGPARYL
jgi:xanthine dehydrogenase accessory factor